MVPGGGSLLSGELDALREELEDYLGVKNEIQAGLKAKLPSKPDELIRYEMCKEMGIPLVAGGVMDQPHIWLLQYGLIKNTIALFDAIADANRRNSNVPS